MTIPRDRDGAKQKPLESEKKETSFHFPPDEKEALKKKTQEKEEEEETRKKTSYLRGRKRRQRTSERQKRPFFLCVHVKERKEGMKERRELSDISLFFSVVRCSFPAFFPRLVFKMNTPRAESGKGVF